MVPRVFAPEQKEHCKENLHWHARGSWCWFQHFSHKIITCNETNLPVWSQDETTVNLLGNNTKNLKYSSKDVQILIHADYVLVLCQGHNVGIIDSRRHNSEPALL